MGNRGYLSADGKMLFESNNSLPAFWLLGFEAEDFQNIQEHIALLQKVMIDDYEDSEAYESYLETFFEENAEAGFLSRGRMAYISALQANTAYIEAVYPDLVPLYCAFVRKLAEAGEGKEKITLGYHEFLGFYDPYQDFLEELFRFAEAVKQKEKTGFIYLNDLRGSTTGYDEYAEHGFETLASDEQLMEMVRQLQHSAIPPAKKKQSFFQKMKDKFQ